MRKGTPAKSMILVGLRGVGKTVLLVRMKDIAQTKGFRAITVEAHEGKSLPALLVPPLRQILFSLNKVEGAKDQAKRGLRILKSFVAGLRFKVEGIEVGLGLEPEDGVADSGDLEADLGPLFVSIGEAARAAQTAVAICIDELQYLEESEFSALIMAVHKTNQERLPLAVIGAGLPQIRALAGQSKSYSERLFDYPDIGALAEVDARAAIEVPAADKGVRFTADAIAEILKQNERYPYFLQQWAHDSWNLANSSPIDSAIVKRATITAIKSLDAGFFHVRFDRCTPGERRYLRALAELGPGPQRSGEIADVLGVKLTTVGPVRSKLISKGMIYSPQYGDMAFTVPMFDDYMRRVMPGDEWLRG